MTVWPTLDELRLACLVPLNQRHFNGEENDEP